MSETKHIQTISGVVVKRSNENTIRVATRVTKVHPLYKKRYSQLRYYIAHNPNDTAKVGDEVTIVACKPISKIKHWVIK